MRFLVSRLALEHVTTYELGIGGTVCIELSFMKLVCIFKLTRPWTYFWLYVVVVFSLISSFPYIIYGILLHMI